jgi:hypothetical protein
MPDWLSVHKPVIVNTIGHSAGVVIFGILLYLFLVNWRRAREEPSSLPAVAAALAMLWNLGSLIALASGPSSGPVADVIVAASFSVLSILPAVLLHISLGSDYRPLWISGYVLSAIAVGLHAGDLLTGAPRFHYAALILVTAGFACITVISVLLELRQKNRAASSRLAGAMGLFLLAISFAHFGSDHPRQAWSGEIALHHAGIPLALLVLLQDYRVARAPRASAASLRRRPAVRVGVPAAYCLCLRAQPGARFVDAGNFPAVQRGRCSAGGSAARPGGGERGPISEWCL